MSNYEHGLMLDRITHCPFIKSGPKSLNTHASSEKQFARLSDSIFNPVLYVISTMGGLLAHPIVWFLDWVCVSKYLLIGLKHSGRMNNN